DRLGIDLGALVILGAGALELRVVALRGLELGGEGEFGVALDLGIQLGGLDVFILPLQAIGELHAHLGGVLAIGIFLHVVLRVFHPLIFERRILRTALLPSAMREAELHVRSPLRVAAAARRDLAQHRLDLVVALLPQIDVDGELVGLGIFSAGARLGIVLGRVGLILAREQDRGEQPFLERIARVAEFLDYVGWKPGRRRYIDRPSFLVVFLGLHRVDDLLVIGGLLGGVAGGSFGAEQGLQLKHELAGPGLRAATNRKHLRGLVSLAHLGVGRGESLARRGVLLRAAAVIHYFLEVGDRVVVF